MGTAVLGPLADWQLCERCLLQADVPAVYAAGQCFDRRDEAIGTRDTDAKVDSCCPVNRDARETCRVIGSKQSLMLLCASDYLGPSTALRGGMWAGNDESTIQKTPFRSLGPASALCGRFGTALDLRFRQADRPVFSGVDCQRRLRERLQYGELGRHQVELRGPIQGGRCAFRPPRRRNHLAALAGLDEGG